MVNTEQFTKTNLLQKINTFLRGRQSQEGGREGTQSGKISESAKYTIASNGCLKQRFSARWEFLSSVISDSATSARPGLHVLYIFCLILQLGKEYQRSYVTKNGLIFNSLAGVYFMSVISTALTCESSSYIWRLCHDQCHPLEGRPMDSVLIFVK